MDMLKWVGWLAFGCVGMEGLSYCLHRFVFHGMLWSIHKTHHRPSRGFELNDLFSILFGQIAVILFIVGSEDRWHSPFYALGLGISLYGLVYFIAHDVYTHQRVFRFRTTNSWLRQIRKAHQRHHRSCEKVGQEPYGLFCFNEVVSKTGP